MIFKSSFPQAPSVRTVTFHRREFFAAFILLYLQMMYFIKRHETLWLLQESSPQNCEVVAVPLSGWPPTQFRGDSWECLACGVFSTPLLGFEASGKVLMGRNSPINWPSPKKTLHSYKAQNSCVLGSREHSGTTGLLAGLPASRRLLRCPTVVPCTRGSACWEPAKKGFMQSLLSKYQVQDLLVKPKCINPAGIVNGNF